MAKRRRCEWCGRLRLAKFIQSWPGGVGCRNEDKCVAYIERQARRAAGKG